LSKNYTGQTINSTQSHSYVLPWTPTSTGDYYVKAGVFNSDWSLNPFWTNKAIGFKVGQSVTTPNPEPQPTTGTYGLSKDINLQETGSITSSPDSNWWLNSGAYFSVVNGIGKTYQGDLPQTDTWNELYKAANPSDTDNGTHPQNLFRLITKAKFKDLSQEAYFKINKYNLSNSEQRYESNGFLFFNRYVDAYNLYYTGVRVDGTAVIKKKINGVYYTMSQNKVFPGTYNHETNPNLLPVGKYIGLKSVVTDLADGSVSIKVYVDKDGTGNWTLGAEAVDTGSSYGPKIQSSASAGIRTDFMDAEFKDYKVNNL
ncbi:MAG TPA: hypothetical protein VK153_01660, partial [Candidatus Paceibacterota bacterium]|nr:hypothetical protein [Candidatus Paceibacterota bacterium]